MKINTRLKLPCKCVDANCWPEHANMIMLSRLLLYLQSILNKKNVLCITMLPFDNLKSLSIYSVYFSV